MNATRLWTLGTIIMIIALLAGTWMIGVSPRLSEATLANDERANVEQQNLMHQATLVALQTQFEGKGELEKELTEMQKAVPSSLELPALINELNRLSGNAGVVVKSLTLGVPTPYVLPTDAAPADPQFTAAMAGITPENLLIIPIDLSVSGTYGAVMAFVSSIQTGDRLILVHDLALASGAMADDAAVEFTLSGQLFVLMDATQAATSNAEAVQAAPAQ
jgi:Tfp pilus assembly protein PilO